MLVSGNKQNSNICNQPPINIKEVQSNLDSLEKKSQTGSISHQKSMSSQISAKVEQERERNLRLYQKIKNKFSCFQYSLRPVHVTEDCNAMIRQYGMLMNQRQYLQKEATKLEYRFSRQTKNKTEPYQFLMQLWKEGKENSHSNSQDMIDRINKTLVKTRQGIRTCLNGQEEQSGGEWTNYVLKSQPYIKLMGQLQLANQKATEMEIASMKLELEYREGLGRQKEENLCLRKQIETLNDKIKSLSQSEIELYRKINILTTEIMKKDKQIDTLKTTQANAKRYLTENNTEGHCYELTILKRQVKGTGYVRIDKTFEQITAYLQTSKGDTLRVLDLYSNSDSHSHSSISDHPPKSEDLLHQADSTTQTPSFSSARKPRRQRELHIFQTQQKSPLNATSVTEMRFVRRR